jgi:heme/copper-type cytochrome/quinol oxidase subunit 2
MIWAFLVSVVLACSRVFIGLTVPPEHITWVAAYKAVAHIFIGVVGAMLYTTRKYRPHEHDEWRAMFWGLCIIEILVAAASRIL